MIEATFSSDPRVVEVQKSLLTLWARRGREGFEILSLVAGIEAKRIEEIATGKSEPDHGEVVILETHR